MFRFVFCCLLVRTPQFATTLQPQSLPNQIFNRYPTLRYLATYVMSSNSYLRNKRKECNKKNFYVTEITDKIAKSHSIQKLRHKI